VARNWIAKAIKHPGALRKSMGLKKNESMSMEMAEHAAKSGGKKTRKRAMLAQTLMRMGRRGAK